MGSLNQIQPACTTSGSFRQNAALPLGPGLALGALALNQPSSWPGMTVESDASWVRKFRHRFVLHVLSRAGALPRGASRRAVVPNCRFRTLRPPKEGSGAPKFAGADRRTRWLALRLSPSRQRTGLPIHNADRRASRRSTAAFSLDLGTAFWRRTGAPIRTPLIPRAFTRFHPLHQPVTGRTHVVGPGDVSRGPRRPGWLGRTLRRRPCSANKRHRLTPSASRDGWNIVAADDGNQAGGSRNL